MARENFFVLRTAPSVPAAPAGDAAHRPPKGGILTAAAIWCEVASIFATNFS